jgi:hypothetical protein
MCHFRMVTLDLLLYYVQKPKFSITFLSHVFSTFADACILEANFLSKYIFFHFWKLDHLDWQHDKRCGLQINIIFPFWDTIEDCLMYRYVLPVMFEQEILRRVVKWCLVVISILLISAGVYYGARGLQSLSDWMNERDAKRPRRRHGTSFL